MYESSKRAECSPSEARMMKEKGDRRVKNTFGIGDRMALLLQECMIESDPSADVHIGLVDI